MGLGELFLLTVANGATAAASFLAVLLRPARFGVLVSMALSYFAAIPLVILVLALVAGPGVLCLGIGIAICGVLGTFVGGGVGELVRRWIRRSRVEETITFRGSPEQFAPFERFYNELATRKAEIDSLTELAGVREAEAANPRWAELAEAGALARYGHESGGMFESLLERIFAGTYSLGELSFHRGIGELTYVPAKRSLAVEILPLKMLVEMFGLEVIGDSREEESEQTVVGGAIFGGAGRRD